VHRVLGGQAREPLGRPPYTGDLDLLVEPTPSNASQLARALAAFGYPELAGVGRSVYGCQHTGCPMPSNAGGST